MERFLPMELMLAQTVINSKEPGLKTKSTKLSKLQISNQTMFIALQLHQLIKNLNFNKLEKQAKISALAILYPLLCWLAI